MSHHAIVIASAASYGIQDCNCFWIGHTIAMMKRAAASGAVRSELRSMSNLSFQNFLNGESRALGCAQAAGEFLRDFSQSAALRIARGRIGEQAKRLRREFLRRHIILDQLGDQRPAGNEIDHRIKGYVD